MWLGFLVSFFVPEFVYDVRQSSIDKDINMIKKERIAFYQNIKKALDEDPKKAIELLTTRMEREAEQFMACIDGQCSQSVFGVEAKHTPGDYSKTQDWLAAMRNHPVFSFVPSGKVSINWRGYPVVWHIEAMEADNHAGNFTYTKYERCLSKTAMALAPGKYKIRFKYSDDSNFYADIITVKDAADIIVEPMVGVLRFNRKFFKSSHMEKVRLFRDGQAVEHGNELDREWLLAPGDYQLEYDDVKTNVTILHAHVTRVHDKSGRTSTVEIKKRCSSSYF